MGYVIQYSKWRIRLVMFVLIVGDKPCHLGDKSYKFTTIGGSRHNTRRRSLKHHGIQYSHVQYEYCCSGNYLIIILVHFFPYFSKICHQVPSLSWDHDSFNTSNSEFDPGFRYIFSHFNQMPDFFCLFDLHPW